MFTFSDSVLPVTRSRWVFFLGGEMIKEGIWKLLLGNERLQKSRVRRFKKKLERLNKLGCLMPVVPVLWLCFSRVGGSDTELISTQSHQSFITPHQFSEEETRHSISNVR